MTLQNFTHFYLLFLSLGTIERLVSTFSPRKTRPNKMIYCAWVYKFLFYSYLVIVILSILEYWANPKPIIVELSLIGLVIYAYGIFLRRAAIKELGEFWSMQTVIKEAHMLITSGIYSKIKHPYYLAVALELIGICLIPNSFLTLIPVIIIQFPLLLIRIKLEEKVLMKHFGDAYRDYAKFKTI